MGSGDILDELDYDHHWHNPLLGNESGVALERIRADLPTERLPTGHPLRLPPDMGHRDIKIPNLFQNLAFPNLFQLNRKSFRLTWMVIRISVL